MTIREFVKQALTDVVAKAKTVFASKSEVPQIIITDNITEEIKQRVAAAPNSVLNYNDTLFYPDYVESGEELPTVYYSHVHDDGAFSQLIIDWTALRVTFSDDVLAKRNSPAFIGTPTAPTAPSGTNTTQIATTAFVNTAIDNLPKPMQFKGSLGTGGTITVLPTASEANIGWTYQVITAGTYAGQTADVGDVFISTGSKWTLIPSGDEPTGTVTSVGAGTGLSISGNPAINPTINVASGYKLPTTAEWEEKEDTFWATYSTTSYADILASHNAGKVVLCNISGTIAQLTSVDSANNKVTFTAEHSNGVLSVDVNASGWSAPSSVSFEKTSNKVTSLSSSSTNTQYPSAKVVYDTAEELRESDAKIQENMEQSVDDGASVYQSAQKFLFRKTGGDSLVMDANNGLIKSIKGRTLVWNQLVQNGDFSDGTTGWRAVPERSISVANKIATIVMESSPANSVAVTSPLASVKHVVGHKYLIVVSARNISCTTPRISPTLSASSSTGASFVDISDSWATYYFFVSPTVSSTSNLSIAFRTQDLSGNAGGSIEAKDIRCHDLTLMFGAGNEPATAAEFRAVYPLSYYSYTPALMKNNAATALESVGFNQWDEEWEVGTISTTTGEKMPNPNGIRSKNDIAVFPNTAYYYRQPVIEGNPRIAFLDVNHETISVIFSGTVNTIFTTPANCHYIRFSTHTTQYGSTYKGDICVNISDPDRNGTYEPYWKATRHLGLDSIQAKEVGSSTIVTINGLDGVGDNVDLLKEGKYIEKNRARVDLGSLNWAYSTIYNAFYASDNTLAWDSIGKVICSKYASVSGVANLVDKSLTGHNEYRRVYIRDTSFDGTTPEGIAVFKTAMAGVMLDYPLATPKEYELVKPINTNYRVDKGGTEKFLPEQTASVILPPVECDMKYKNIGVEGYKLITDAMWDSKANLAGSSTQDFAVRSITIAGSIKDSLNHTVALPGKNGTLATLSDITYAQARPQIVQAGNYVKIVNGGFVTTRDFTTQTWTLSDFFDYYILSIGATDAHAVQSEGDVAILFDYISGCGSLTIRTQAGTSPYNDSVSKYQISASYFNENNAEATIYFKSGTTTMGTLTITTTDVTLSV